MKVNNKAHTLFFILAALGLRCCMQATGGYSLVAVCSLLIGWLPLLQSMGWRALGLQKFWYTDSVAPRYVESSWTGDQTHVPFTGRRILNHWTMREVFHTRDHFLHCFVEQWIPLNFKIFLWTVKNRQNFISRFVLAPGLVIFLFFQL